MSHGWKKTWRLWSATIITVWAGAAVAQDAAGPVAPLPSAGEPAASRYDDGAAAGPVGRPMSDVRMEIKPMSEIDLELTVRDRELPPDNSGQAFAGSLPVGRMTSTVSEFHWQPANFFHQPLYFDDTPLERYGQTICPPLQPVISGTRFFLTFPIMPYKLGVDRTHDCVTTAGLYRPGNCAPCVREVLPHEADATLFQTATTLGWIFLLP